MRKSLLQSLKLKSWFQKCPFISWNLWLERVLLAGNTYFVKKPSFRKWSCFFVDKFLSTFEFQKNFCCEWLVERLIIWNGKRSLRGMQLILGFSMTTDSLYQLVRNDPFKWRTRLKYRRLSNPKKTIQPNKIHWSEKNDYSEIWLVCRIYGERYFMWYELRPCVWSVVNFCQFNLGIFIRKDSKYHVFPNSMKKQRSKKLALA